MARKRRIVVTRPMEIEPLLYPEDEEKGWGEWFKQTYARYWFAIGSIFIDIMVALSLADIFDGISIPLFALIALAVVEVTIYLRIWGVSPWSD